MLFSRLVAPIVLLSGAALGQRPASPTIINSIYAVSNTTAALGNLVNAWTGSIPGAIGVMRVSDKLSRHLRWAARVANLSQSMSVNDANNLAAAMTQLQTVTNVTLSRMVSRQTDFNRLRLTKTIRRALMQQRLRFNQMTTRVQVKLPQNMLSNSRFVTDRFDDLYAGAVRAFSTSTYRRPVNNWGNTPVTWTNFQA